MSYYYILKGRINDIYCDYVSDVLQNEIKSERKYDNGVYKNAYEYKALYLSLRNVPMNAYSTGNYLQAIQKYYSEEAELIKNVNERIIFENVKTAAFPLLWNENPDINKAEALNITLKVIKKIFSDNSELENILLVADSIPAEFKETTVDEYNRRIYLHQVASFLSSSHDISNAGASLNRKSSAGIIKKGIGFGGVSSFLEKKKSEPDFKEALCNYIDMRIREGMYSSDVDVYKKARCSRQTFSKIINSKSYNPSKKTVFSLALALKLNFEQTSFLLESAGYSFGKKLEYDNIIECCIINRIYDIDEVNFILDSYKHDVF